MMLKRMSLLPDHLSDLLTQGDNLPSIYADKMVDSRIIHSILLFLYQYPQTLQYNFKRRSQRVLLDHTFF